MVTDCPNAETTDSEMHKVCESINEEHSFFDVDMSDVVDEKMNTDVDIDSNFEEIVGKSLDNNSFFWPEWSYKVKPLKKNVLESQVIIGQDINASGSKVFAIFNSHQEMLEKKYENKS